MGALSGHDEPAVVEQAIGVSLRRMGWTPRPPPVPLVDYPDQRYLDALRHLADLQRRKIRHLALTNFDTERSQSSPARHPIVSNRCSIRS